MSLFKSIDEVVKYIRVNVNSNFDTIKTYIEEAEENHIIPALGDTDYFALENEYQLSPGTAMSVKYANLLPLAQRSLINYAYFLSVADGSINISDSGFTVVRTEKTEPAPQWKIAAFASRRLLAADQALDKMLEYLERHRDIYTDWAASESFTILKDSFVTNAADFSKYAGINNSRRVFLKLKPFIRQAEDLKIKSLIGLPQYDILKQQHLSGELTEDNIKLIYKLKPLVANYSLIIAIPQLQVSISDSGIYINSETDGMLKKDNASDMQIKVLSASLKDTYQNYEEELKYWLAKNIEKFPLYQESNAYSMKASPGSKHIFINDPNSSIFGV